MRYGSVARKTFKIRWGLHNKGLVEDHHIIPKHPTVQKFEYDIHASSNLVVLPTRHGKCVLHLREERLVHTGKHQAYNAYVEYFVDFLKVSWN